MSELSVIITSRNQSREIGEMLGRIQDDALDGAEFIIVDDCSEIDDFKRLDAIVDAWHNDRGSRQLSTDASVIRLDAWGCAGGARNRGARRAVGDYLWFVDGDDEICRGAIARMVDFIRALNSPKDIICLPYSEGVPGQMFPHLLEGGEICPKPFMWRIAPWGKLIRREIFVPFAERCFYEDTDWHFKQCDVATTRDFLPGRSVYIYRCDVTGNQMEGIRRLEQNWTASGHRDNLKRMLGRGDEVLIHAVAQRLQMIGRLCDAHLTLRRHDIREYVAQFVQLMMETIQPERRDPNA